MLPDDLPVYPTHGAGSFCSTGADGERTTTIGRERAANPLLDAPDEDAFVALLLGGLGTTELGTLVGPALSELPGRVTFMCGHGERAMSAASLAERSGREAAVFVGGPDQWARRSGRPLAHG